MDTATPNTPNTPNTPQGLARLCPGAALAGHAEDNGDLLVHYILPGLPADVIPLVAAATQALYRAARGIPGGPARIYHVDTE